MFLPVLGCLLFYFVCQSTQVNLIPKCCEESLEVDDRNSTLGCKDKTNSRLQVQINSSLLEKSSDGECVDSNGEGFFHYQVKSTVLVSKTPVSTPIFQKCCPINHIYNNKTRSCTLLKNSTNEDFIEGQFVKVGLPHCQMILDKTFKNASDATFLAKNLKPLDYCLDRDVDNNYVVRECQEGLYLCEHKRCYKKCCPDGQSYVGGAKCQNTYVHGLELENQGYSPYIKDLGDDYELIYGTGCPKVSLIPKNTFQYTIGKKGEWRYYYNFSSQFMEHNYSDFKTYCLEHARKGNIAGYHLFQCLKDTPLDSKFSYTMWAKILSIIFLIATIVLYFYMGEIKRTFGKILINYCLAMIFLMVILVVAHIVRNPDRWDCKIRAYLLIFFNMSAFAWVNVMSLDIWLTFGTPKRTIGSDQRKKDLKKFLLYFLYGWGMPLCLTLLILIFEVTRILPESIHPYIGIYSCFIENRIAAGNYARSVLIIVPQLILQIINTILFIKTIMYCIRVKNEIRKMNDSARTKENGRFNADTERLGLIVKLAVIMGVIWIFEVISAFFVMKNYSSFTRNLEVVMDNITCLQGVFIFIIFICKKKTLTTIREKMGAKQRRISRSISMTQTSQMNGHTRL